MQKSASIFWQTKTFYIQIINKHGVAKTRNLVNFGASNDESTVFTA